MFLGYRLKQLRKSRGLSQSELGELLGVSKVSISGYEKGLRVPSMDILLTILKVFNISADYILGRELSVVCEGENSESLLLASIDVKIIEEIRSKPQLYSIIANDPKRFFNNISKNYI